MRKYTYEANFGWLTIIVDKRIIEILIDSTGGTLPIFLESSSFSGKIEVGKSRLEISSESKFLIFDSHDIKTNKVRIFYDEENFILKIVANGFKIKIESYDPKTHLGIMQDLVLHKE